MYIRLSYSEIARERFRRDAKMDRISARNILGLAGIIALAGMVWTAPLRSEEVATVELVLKDHVFTPAEVSAAAGKPLTIKVINRDPTPAEFESGSLKIEKIVPGNSEIVVEIRQASAGRHEFVDEYHEDSAKGVIVAE